MGLFVEVVHAPEEHGDFVVQLFARKIGTAQTAWLLDERPVTIPPVAPDPEWRQLLSTPLPFDIELELDVDDLDLYLIVAIDGDPRALKPLFVRPAVPEPDDARR